MEHTIYYFLGSAAASCLASYALGYLMGKKKANAETAAAKMHEEHAKLWQSIFKQMQGGSHE